MSFQHLHIFHYIHNTHHTFRIVHKLIHINIRSIDQRTQVAIGVKIKFANSILTQSERERQIRFVDVIDNVTSDKFKYYSHDSSCVRNGTN